MQEGRVVLRGGGVPVVLPIGHPEGIIWGILLLTKGLPCVALGEPFGE